MRRVLLSRKNYNQLSASLIKYFPMTVWCLIASLIPKTYMNSNSMKTSPLIRLKQSISMILNFPLMVFQLMHMAECSPSIKLAGVIKQVNSGARIVAQQFKTPGLLWISIYIIMTSILLLDTPPHLAFMWLKKGSQSKMISKNIYQGALSLIEKQRRYGFSQNLHWFNSLREIKLFLNLSLTEARWFRQMIYQQIL